MPAPGMDYGNIIALMMRCDLEAWLAKARMKYDEFAKVSYWRPANNTPDDCELVYDNDKVHLIYESLYPVLEGVNVKWGYSPDLLSRAFRVFEVFEKEPRFLCCKSCSPLIVEEKKSADRQKDDDIIILIAPRVQNGED